MIQCPSCSRTVAHDPNGRMPPWCPTCGSDLKAGAAPRADVPATEPAAPGSSVQVAEPPPLPATEPPPVSKPKSFAKRLRKELEPPRSNTARNAIFFVAILCGLLAAFWVNYESAGPPAPIVRRTFQVQPPHAGWKVDEERQWLERAELALRLQSRNGDLSYFIVQVVSTAPTKPSLEVLLDQLRKDWQARQPAPKLQNAESGKTALAGQPAHRLTAKIGERRRQVILLIDQGVCFRVTCDAEDQRFESLKHDFDLLLASFEPGPHPEARSAP